MMRFALSSCLVLSAVAVAIAISFAGSSAQAYIPSSRTILARTAKNAGKGLYAIDQEIQFRSLAEPITLRERWFIENGESLRLYVMPMKAAKEAYRFDAYYHDGKKTAPDGAGGLQTTGLPPDFIEGFEHFRSGHSLLEALVHAKILPSSLLHVPPKIANVASIKHLPEPMLRLGRSSAGEVSWIFGEPTPTEGARLNPEVWVTQDAFVLQKIRFPSQAEVTADKFSSSGTLRVPRERTITWNNNTVVIQVLSIKPVVATPAMTKLFTQASITAADSRASHLPDQPVVREFYSRFR